MKITSKIYFGLLSFALLAPLTGCNRAAENAAALDEEGAQQIGEVMASIDEAGGSSGSLSLMNEIRSAEKALARQVPDRSRSEMSFKYSLSNIALPRAQATTCAAANTFSSCSSNSITRNFSGCTIGTATLTGTVTLTWTDSSVSTPNSCLLSSDGDTVSRLPAFTITGPRGGTMTVSGSGAGQVITRLSAGTFSYENDGIRRVISQNSLTIADFSTVTSGPLTVSGTARSGRVLTSSGGNGIVVTDEWNGGQCTYVPSNVTWGSTCNCATSGSWTASCASGQSATLTITGCGTATYTVDGESTSVTFDRCQSI